MSQTIQQRSRLLRLAVTLALFLTGLAVIGLIFEWINFTRASSHHPFDLRGIRLILLGTTNLVFAGFLAAIVALYFWARMARSLPDLKPWHLESPVSEFRATDATAEYTLNDFLKQEERVFGELEEYIAGPWAAHSSGAYSRFHPQSACNPKTAADRNWNRTQVEESADPIGGVLLLHGLSDSPYSLRAVGQRLLAEGFTVVWLRVPGHGTNPRALAETTCEDWMAAVKVAMNGLRDLVPDGMPLVLAGFSNGGALSLNYALEAVQDSSLPKVAAIVLFSPMIGVNPLAKMTRLYHAVGLFSRDEKAKWSNIYAEIDPFKYSSWPMNANVQAWKVTTTVERKLARLEKSGRMDHFPPVVAMQSVVDSTVVVPKLVTALFDRLTSECSELFLFDVNREDSLSNLLNLSFEKNVLPWLERTDRPFRLTVMRNEENSKRLLLSVRNNGEWTQQSVDMSWPPGFVSLSHVAVPIRPDDPIYGNGSEPSGLQLGILSMRAEPSALMIPNTLFVRCRHNPFYDFMEGHMIDWLSQNLNVLFRSAD